MGCDMSKEKSPGGFDNLAETDSVPQHAGYGAHRGDDRRALLKSAVSIRFEQQLAEALAISEADAANKGGGGGGGGQLAKQREELRRELVLLAPTIRLLFRDEMPDPRCSYAVPLDDDIDPTAARYLGDLIDVLLEQQDVLVMPLMTTGDGSCMLHAASRGMWGVELFSPLLRERVLHELKDEKAWYCERVSESDWALACREAASASQYLGNLHLVALAHVLRRPVYLYSSVQDARGLGSGFFGVTFAAFPLRFHTADCIKRPIAIAWASKSHNHFVPLVWASSGPAPKWPQPSFVINNTKNEYHTKTLTNGDGGGGGAANRFSSMALSDPFAVPLDPSGENPYVDYGKSRVQEPVFIQDLIERIRLLRTDVEARLRAGDAVSIDPDMLQALLPKSIYMCKRLSVFSSVSVPQSSAIHNNNNSSDGYDSVSMASESMAGQMQMPDLMRFSSNLIQFSAEDDGVVGGGAYQEEEGGFSALVGPAAAGGPLPPPPPPQVQAPHRFASGPSSGLAGSNGSGGGFGSAAGNAQAASGALLWKRAISAYKSQRATVNGTEYDYACDVGNGRVIGINSGDNAFAKAAAANVGGGGDAGDMAELATQIANTRRQEQVRRQTMVFSSNRTSSSAHLSISGSASARRGLSISMSSHSRASNASLGSASGANALLPPGTGSSSGGNTGAAAGAADVARNSSSGDDFAGLAAAVVRIVTEMRALQEMRPDGVDVQTGEDLLSWKIVIAAPLSASRGAPPPYLFRLQFPRNYPQSPPKLFNDSLNTKSELEAEVQPGGGGGGTSRKLFSAGRKASTSSLSSKPRASKNGGSGGGNGGKVVPQQADEAELNALLARAWRPLDGLESVLVALQTALFPPPPAQASASGRGLRRQSSSGSGYGNFMNSVDAV